MKKTVLSYGELLWDILPTATILGGAPFNFAYRINALGDRGLMVSRLGRDELGRSARARVVDLGLDTTYLQWDDEHPTGTVNVSFDARNNPDYVINPGVAYDHIDLTQELQEIAKNADCLCFGTLCQREQQSRATITKLIDCSPHSLKFLDINLRKKCYSLDTLEFSLQKADVLKLNEQEAIQLGQILRFPDLDIPQFCTQMIRKWSLQYCIVTLAERGAYAQSNQDEHCYLPGYRVSLTDSLGAGDAFSAGFIHKILRNDPMQAACQFGNTLGAIVATQKGATTPITADDLGQFSQRPCKRIIEESLKSFIPEKP